MQKLVYYKAMPGVHASGFCFLKHARPGVTISCSRPEEARAFEGRTEARLFKFKNDLHHTWKLDILERFLAADGGVVGKKIPSN